MADDAPPPAAPPPPPAPPFAPAAAGGRPAAWRSLRGPARWTVVLLAACAVWAVFGAFTDGVGLRWTAVEPDGDPALDDLSARLDQIAFFTGLPLALATPVAFVVWFHRALADARLAGGRVPEPGWGAGSWFVPGAHLVVPYRATRGAWRTGHPAGEPGPLLPAWWICWVLSATLAAVAIALRPVEDFDLDRWRSAYTIHLGAMVLAVAAAVLAIVVVRRVTVRLEARSRHAGGADRLVAAPEPAFVTLDARARPASLALALVGVVALARVGVDVNGLSAVGRAETGGRAAEDALSTAETAADVAGGVWLCALVLAIVLFLMWFHRAIRNLHAPGLGLVRYTPGWAVGSWFVPFVNLVVPKKAANDAWRAGDPHADVPVFLHLWWVAWIATSILGNISSRALWSPRKDLDSERGYYTVDLVGSVFEIVAAVLAILVVRSVTARHAERLRLGPYQPPKPPPEDDSWIVEPAWKPVPSD